MSDRTGRRNERETAGGEDPGSGEREKTAREDEIARGGRESTEHEGAAELEPGVTETEQTGAVEGSGEDPASRNAELLDSLMRLKAEFDNYRKRILREQTRLLETAEAGLVTKLLPVIDNLERALENAPGDGGSGGLRKGVEMVLGQLLEVLWKEGLEAVIPEGEPFDPEHHEAMMVVETDGCPEGTVLEVVQRGYRFSGELLRPAMVKVSCPVRDD